MHRRYDGEWGKPDASGNFSDSMVAMLAEGAERSEVDLMACSLTLTPERSRAVDYLYPIGTETYAIYINNPDQVGGSPEEKHGGNHFVVGNWDRIFPRTTAKNFL